MDKARIAVDIGGTFTDCVLAGDGHSILATVKTPTTPGDPTDGALAGVQELLSETGLALADIQGFVHGTTLATNALIERRGACVASITTAGFRDILEIAYERRYSQYDINLEKPDLIVPRARAFTICGRINARGEEIVPLDTQSVAALVEDLQACGTEAVAICLLHAYANSSHEQQLAALLREALPDLVISLSSDVSPEAREFDRLCTTIANAYIQPLMAGYLTNFERRLREAGLTCPILMMTAGGGMTTIPTAIRLPIRLLESGPAGGAILAAHLAAGNSESEVLSFDMGGTTAKLCLIDDHRPQTARSFEIARAERFIKGSGMPVRIPAIEMIEIGAGGGSIATVDGLGRLQVGPKSAGSEPGPAAFGLGGSKATVTDADFLLGYILLEHFAEGRISLNRRLAEKALSEDVAQPLDLKVVAAAAGVSDIADESMAAAGRMHAVESGKDLGRRTMIAFGGNGPLHATRVARRAGVTRILIPNDPGVGSAIGFLTAPISFEIVRSHYTTLSTVDRVALNGFLQSLEQEATAVVRSAAPDFSCRQTRIAFMRYHGQGHEIPVVLPNRDLQDGDVAQLEEAFESAYRQQFFRTVPDMTVEILNWSVTVAAVQEPHLLNGVDKSKSAATPQHSSIIYCEVEERLRDADVYLRDQLSTGVKIHGPALITEPQTTTWVSADFTAEVAADGCLILQRAAQEFS